VNFFGVTEENKMADYDTQQGGESRGTGGSGAAARMKEQVSEKATDVKGKVADFGRKTAETIDSTRESAAGALDQTASSLHSAGDKVSGAAHSTAENIQAGADYVRRTDLKGMAEDLQDLVKRYPGQSLVAAAILGFLVARGLRSSD
jgi:TolA-binding protein